MEDQQSHSTGREGEQIQMWAEPCVRARQVGCVGVLPGFKHRNDGFCFCSQELSGMVPRNHAEMIPSGRGTGLPGITDPPEGHKDALDELIKTLYSRLSVFFK